MLCVVSGWEASLLGAGLAGRQFLLNFYPKRGPFIYDQTLLAVAQPRVWDDSFEAFPFVPRRGRSWARLIGCGGHVLGVPGGC